MAISTLAQTIMADDLSETVVTAIVQDEATGLHVREFRFFGVPTEAGAQPPLVLTVRAVSPEANSLSIKTPVLSI